MAVSREHPCNAEATATLVAFRIAELSFMALLTTMEATEAVDTVMPDSTQVSMEAEHRRAARAVSELLDHQEHLDPMETPDKMVLQDLTVPPETMPLQMQSPHQPTSVSTAHLHQLVHQADLDLQDHPETQEHQDRTEMQLFPDPQDHQDQWDPLEATDSLEHLDSPAHPDKSLKFPAFPDPLDHLDQWDRLDHLVSLVRQAAHCRDHQDHQETQEWTVPLEILEHLVRLELKDRPALAAAATTVHHHVLLPVIKRNPREMLISAIMGLVLFAAATTSRTVS